MDKQLGPKEDEIFGDIYVYDKKVEKRIKELVEGERCRKLIKEAELRKNTLSLLDEVVPVKRTPAFPKLLSKLYPFYRASEFHTKEEYLNYLKQVYGFLLTPMEVPPGRMINLFFPDLAKSWSTSSEGVLELLKKFYVEVALINELSQAEWEQVANAQNPEAEISKLIFRTKFTPDFEELLRTIPWIISADVYGSPGLDIMYRRAPGHEIPKKPFGVGEVFLKKLVDSSVNNQTHSVIVVGDEKVKLSEIEQITAQIDSEGSAHIDSFVGISKIERDFVIHQHIIIWYNPGFERYEKASFLGKIKYSRPPKFLCAIREEALPLEVPFVKHRKGGH